MLARRADLIVLDEPTSGLDAGGRELYLRAFAAELRAAPPSSPRPTTSRRRSSTTRCSCSRGGSSPWAPAEVLTADRLLDTFGIVLRDPHDEHPGRLVVAETTHGGPQVVEVGPDITP